MTGLLVLSDDLTKYDFGSDHPMAPGRVTNTISLARQLGVLDRLRIVPPPEIDLALLQTVHTPDYIAAVQRGEPNQRYGLGTSDNPVFPGMHEIAAWVTMASFEAARRVWIGDVQRACNISGGLHHAMPSTTSGFCVYNDVAVAIARQPSVVVFARALVTRRPCGPWRWSAGGPVTWTAVRGVGCARSCSAVPAPWGAGLSVT